MDGLSEVISFLSILSARAGEAPIQKARAHPESVFFMDITKFDDLSKIDYVWNRGKSKGNKKNRVLDPIFLRLLLHIFLLNVETVQKKLFFFRYAFKMNY